MCRLLCVQDRQEGLKMRFKARFGALVVCCILLAMCLCSRPSPPPQMAHQPSTAAGDEILAVEAALRAQVEKEKARRGTTGQVEWCALIE